MANPNPNKPIVPSITGYPQLDTLLATGIIAGAGIIDGKIYGLMDAHALAHADYETAIYSATVATLAAIATIIWRVILPKLVQNRAAEHVMSALTTGEVSDTMVKAAVKAPNVTEEELTKALNNAEAIKNQQ